jgi:hypothetical protein
VQFQSAFHCPSADPTSNPRALGVAIAHNVQNERLFGRQGEATLSNSALLCRGELLTAKLYRYAAQDEAAKVRRAMIACNAPQASFWRHASLMPP